MAAVLSSSGNDASHVDLLEASAKDISEALACGHVTSVELVKAYLKRIDADNTAGLGLRAVIEVAPYESVISIARSLDVERAEGRVRSPLHGVPIIVKDNLNTDIELGMSTTAGSYTLLQAGGTVKGDAFVISKLREAGVIILGKANLEEWSHVRGNQNPWAWSPRGGQVSSPYVKGGFAAGGDPGGSSSGSGAGVAAGFAPLAIGTDTEGSIVVPSSRSALYGLRPSTGLTSRSGVVPNTISQDTTGPMGKSAWDIAAALSIMAEYDPEDPDALSAAPFIQEDYTKFIDADGFQGLRIGIAREPAYNISAAKTDREKLAIEATFATFDRLKELGATIVETPLPNSDQWQYEFIGGPKRVNNGTIQLHYDLKADMAHYLQTTRINSSVLTLEDIINWNDEHPELESPPGRRGQPTFIAANQLQDRSISAEYWKAKRAQNKLHRDGPDALFRLYNVDLLLVPTEGYAARFAAVGKLPVGTVPLGYDQIGMPFGMAFIGNRYDEPAVIRAMSAFEANFPQRRVPSLLT